MTSHHSYDFTFDLFFWHPLWSKMKYINYLDGLPKALLFVALLALPFIRRHLAINGHLALSHKGNTQNPQSFLWGARETEMVAGRCPMWMMAKITHTRIHTSYTCLQNAVKDEFVFYLLQWSEQPVSHKHHYSSVRQTDTLTLNNRFHCRVVTILLPALDF